DWSSDVCSSDLFLMIVPPQEVVITPEPEFSSKNRLKSSAEGKGFPTRVYSPETTGTTIGPLLGLPLKSYLWAFPGLFFTPSMSVGSKPFTPFIVNPYPAGIDVLSEMGFQSE